MGFANLLQKLNFEVVWIFIFLSRRGLVISSHSVQNQSRYYTFMEG